jgi:hypothetical protein
MRNGLLVHFAVGCVAFPTASAFTLTGPVSSVPSSSTALFSSPNEYLTNLNLQKSTNNEQPSVARSQVRFEYPTLELRLLIIL